MNYPSINSMNTTEHFNFDDSLFAAEAFLDGEAPRPAVEEAVISVLRTERADRAAFYAANEQSTDGAAVDRLLFSIRREASRDQTRRIATGGATPWFNRFGPLRVGVAAAACVAIGYFGGALYRDGGAAPSGPGALPGLSTPVDFNVGPAAPASPDGGVGGAFVVPLMDEQGHVVATRRFDTRDEARRFIESYRAGTPETLSPTF